MYNKVFVTWLLSVGVAILYILGSLISLNVINALIGIFIVHGLFALNRLLKKYWWSYRANQTCEDGFTYKGAEFLCHDNVWEMRIGSLKCKLNDLPKCHWHDVFDEGLKNLKQQKYGKDAKSSLENKVNASKRDLAYAETLQKILGSEPE